MSAKDGDLESINPEGWRRPPGYSNAVLAPAGGRVLFVAGQIGWDSEERLVGAGLVEQFEQAMANVVTIVEAAGGRAEHIGRLTVFVVDRHDYVSARREIGQGFRRVMGRHFPAMALVEVRALLEPGALVEVEATAVLPASSEERQP